MPSMLFSERSHVPIFVSHVPTFASFVAFGYGHIGRQRFWFCRVGCSGDSIRKQETYCSFLIAHSLAAPARKPLRPLRGSPGGEALEASTWGPRRPRREALGASTWKPWEPLRGSPGGLCVEALGASYNDQQIAFGLINKMQLCWSTYCTFIDKFVPMNIDQQVSLMETLARGGGAPSHDISYYIIIYHILYCIHILFVYCILYATNCTSYIMYGILYIIYDILYIVCMI